MLSSDDDLHDIDDSMHDLGHTAGKRRKVLRACDVCRRKKIRCDAHDRPDTRCTHCVTYKFDCTFVETAKKRGPPKGYIDDLEKRCQDLEALVARVAPQVKLDEEVGPSFTKDTWAIIKGPSHSRGSRSSLGAGATATSTNGSSHRAMQRQKSSPTLPDSPGMPGRFPLKHCGMPLDTMEPMTLDVTSALNSDDERNYPGRGTLTKHIEREMEEMNISTGFEKRFHGKSSGVTLIQVAMNLKDEVVGDANKYADRKTFPLRAKFWKPNPWEWMVGSLPPIEDLTFPPDDLATELIELCFNKGMIVFPIIHRPTFERLAEEGQHRKDINFARVYLLVCAVGCRYTNDERVCLKSPTGEIEWNSAGWTYFAQVMAMKRPLLAPVGLSDLQCTALMSVYLQGTSAPHAAWLVAGLGLRFAQDIGAHREKVYGADHPFENQMWKRAFWSLVALDRMTSTGLGRPIAVFDEDIDADLPLEVDDEYYDAEKKEWKQPEGKPSRITAFTHYVKLQGILAYAIRTVYSINKSKVHLGFVGPEWESHTVAELDSALNSWLDNIPDYLRWDPTIEDPIQLHQAAALRLTYHYVQITIHRPFIPVLNGKASPLSFPSLAICTNAARSTSHILENYVDFGFETTPFTHVIAFTAGTVLLISIWGVKKNKLNVDVSNQITDVHRCIKVLHKAEKKWHTAGRLVDILTELATMNDVPIPQQTPTPPDSTRKRDREGDDDESLTLSPSGSSTYPVSPPSIALTGFGDPTISNFARVPRAGPSAASYIARQQQTLPSPPAQPWGMPPQSQSFADLPTEAAPAWDTYHIGGMEIPGMNTSLTRSSAAMPGSSFQDSLSPYTMFQGLLNTFQNPDAQLSQQQQQQQQQQSDLWNMQQSGDNEFGWLNDMGLYGLTPSSAPGPN